MTKMKQNNGVKKLNILLTAILICVSVVLVALVYVPKFIGLKSYVIESGSMEPTLKINSVIYVEPQLSVNNYNENDIVTFTDPESGKSFTHRVIVINSDNGTFITKGDANKDIDPIPTSSEYAVGKVMFNIPYIGALVKFLRFTFVKIAVGAIYVAWAAIEIELYIIERKKRDD